jgi:hypothetical protein
MALINPIAIMKELTFKERFLLAQSNIKKIEKDGKNPHFKSTYTTLPHALEQILPQLQDNKLIYRTELQDDKLITIIEDVLSDACFKTEIKLINTIDMQKMGSAITYAQRYGLLSIMGLASGIDDDGNDSSIKTYAINSDQIEFKEPIKTTVAIDVKNIIDYKKIIEHDKIEKQIEKQFIELVKDNKALFSQAELITYRNYIIDNNIEKMKNTIVKIQTKIMKE